MILDLFRLDGKVAVVTGAGTGIGRGIALGLAEAGAHVVVAGRRPEPLAAVAEALTERGSRSLAVPTDVTRSADVDALVRAAIDTFGGVDIWVNNAGGLQGVPLSVLAELSDDHWDAVVALNFTAVFRCSRAAAHVLPDGGCIINVSSSGSLREGMARNGVYTASKSGINHLTKTLAAELAPRRIRVNAIAPGPVQTEDYEEASGFTDAQFAKLGTKVALGRLGQESDFGAAAVYLASPASAWVTGIILPVTGGPVG